jgi:hypothetical protein
MSTAAGFKSILTDCAPLSASFRLGMTVVSFAALAACGGQPVTAADDLGEICATLLCRQPGPFRMTKDDGTTFDMRIRKAGPFVHEGRVSVLANETVYVEAEMRDGQLVELTAVPSVRQPEKTLVFALSQEPGRPEMMLQVTNPFPQPVKYHAVMMVPDRDGLLQTSTCPVIGGGRAAFEMWSHAVFQLLLFDFRLLDPNAGAMACEY